MAQPFESMLANWLKSQDMSPEQAAPLLGVGHVAIYAWLNGDYQPSNTKIPSLSRALQIPEADLRPAIEKSRRLRSSKQGRAEKAE
jgi:DNA-binding transcriptional regulator YdaS (Cro superfamily)